MSNAPVNLWQQPHAKPNCEACPFAKNGQPGHRPVLSECRVANPRAVLVGEGPGSEEAEKGVPFVGRTGQWLDAKLVETGLDRGRLAVLNATACQPPRGLKNDSNMAAATAACRPLFLAQFKQWKSLPTLAMGKWAGAAVNEGKPITIETGRGFIRKNLLVTWHPTYAAFYNPWKAGEFVNDLERFKRLVEGRLEQGPIVITKPTVKDIQKLAGTSKVLACDIETRAPAGKPDYWGKDPTRCELRTIALGNSTLGISYWWGSDAAVESAIIKVLHDHKIVKVFHNGHHFDLRVLRRYSINPFPVRDTRDSRRAVSATSRLSLRYITSLYCDFAPWKETEDDK